MSSATLAPRKPQKRDDVVSRTPLRLRERIAFVRYWLHLHPRTAGFLIGLVLIPTVERYQTTFPAIWTAVSAVTTVTLGLFGISL